MFDPAVDQLIRSFYDNQNADSAITLLVNRFSLKAKSSSSQVYDNAIRDEIQVIMSEYPSHILKTQPME